MKKKQLAIGIWLLNAVILSNITQATASDYNFKMHHPIHYKPMTSHLLPQGLSPHQVSVAYGFNTINSQGKGQTIAIVDAFDDPRIEADLAVFNKTFGLPACTTSNGCFKKIYARGKKPPTDAGWSGEIALDVEWAHAMAPQAKIILVEAASDNANDLFQAVQVAIENKAQVVSLSWGAPEFTQQSQLDKLFNNPLVTFTASSGDNGTGVIYPAASPHVIAVGGSTLMIDHYGNYQGETAWSGSGGGMSNIESWPSYQQAFPIPNSKNMRGVPDVAYNADPQSGFSVYSSVPGDGGIGWQVVGGTSAGSPQWAALVALINASLSKTVGNTLHSQLYDLAKSTAGSSSTVLNDIDTGSNGDCGYYCTAASGYDYVTGLGSPEIHQLIPALVHHNKTTS